MKTGSISLVIVILFLACGHPPVMPESLRDDPAIDVGTEEGKEAPESDQGLGSDDPTSPTGPTGPTGPTSPTEPNDPEPGFVVINEIYYDAVGSDTDGILFVELYGTAGLSVAGCRVAFVNGDTGATTDSITLPEDAEVGGDGFYLIADSRDGQTGVSQVVGADLVDNLDPQNGPDAVQLFDRGGGLLDALGYGEGILTPQVEGNPTMEGTPAPDVASGHSLERASPGVDTDNNLADFVDRPVPTPGGSL